MVEGVEAVVAGDGEEAGGAEALVEGVGEGVADPVEIGLAGAVVEGQDEDDAAAESGVGCGRGLGACGEGEEERRGRGGDDAEESAYLPKAQPQKKYRAELWVGSGGVSEWRVIEAEDGGPLAVAVSLPDDFAVEEGGGFVGAEVVVEVEVLGVGGLVARERCWRAPGGGAHLVEKRRAVS